MTDIAPVDAKGCAPYIIDVHGDLGRAWLSELPTLIAAVADRWSLTILPPFPNLSYNYVTPVIGPDGEPLALKAGVPHPELRSEIEALRAFDGHGSARLVAADAALGVLLMERVLPGDALWTLGDDDAMVTAVAPLMQWLWRPLPPSHDFRTVADLATGLDKLHRHFDDGYGPFPPAQVDRARALFRELTAGADDVLIHGDLNPGNVLRAIRERWLAIDPKGYAGNPLYDVATFLSDIPEGLEGPSLRRRQERLVAHISDALGYPRAEILAWAEAHAVLSGWWSYEDHGTGWEPALALAALYASMSL